MTVSHHGLRRPCSKSAMAAFDSWARCPSTPESSQPFLEGSELEALLAF
jgi:hypothetical protein